MLLISGRMRETCFSSHLSRKNNKNFRRKPRVEVKVSSRDVGNRFCLSLAFNCKREISRPKRHVNDTTSRDISFADANGLTMLSVRYLLKNNFFSLFSIHAKQQSVLNIGKQARENARKRCTNDIMSRDVSSTQTL